MTRQETIKWLESLKAEIGKSEHRTLWHYVEAIDMAIKALQDIPTGKWIDKVEYAECSNCGANSGTQFDGVEPIPSKTNFCHHCGADMRVEVM